ncbi:hypothetical protein G6F40_017201 [Rhizopus arrhizus]|nr:hypothetical protein G6F40_017201 [Rhizopus arrhizus]
MVRGRYQQRAGGGEQQPQWQEAREAVPAQPLLAVGRGEGAPPVHPETQQHAGHAPGQGARSPPFPRPDACAPSGSASATCRRRRADGCLVPRPRGHCRPVPW